MCWQLLRAPIITAHCSAATRAFASLLSLVVHSLRYHQSTGVLRHWLVPMLAPFPVIKKRIQNSFMTPSPQAACT